MLNCIVSSSPDEFHTYFDKLSSKDVTWITSQIAGKFDIQRRLLAQSSIGILGGEPVLRAREFWSQLLAEKDPQWITVSREYSLYLVKKWIDEFNGLSPIYISPLDFRQSFDMFIMLMPLLSHEEGHSALSQWFSDKPEALNRWSKHYALSQFIWQKFNQKKIIPEASISGLLLNYPSIVMESGKSYF